MSAIPILKLPILVLMKILKTIDIETVFLISLCSRKMYHLVKIFRDKIDTLRLVIDGRNSSVWVKTPEDNYLRVNIVEGKSRNLERVNINGHLVPMDRIPAVYEHLSELLEYKGPPEVTVNRNTLWLLSYIEKRQGDNYHLVIGDIGEEEEVCHFILKNYHPQVVRILSLPDNFPIAQYMNSIESLFVGSQLSITLDNLLNMNCVELVLWEIHFTGTEINQILQHWAIGGFPRLKYLSSWVSDFNMEDVLGELTHTRMTEKREYKSNIENVTFSDCLITRNDGVVASLQYDQQYRRVHFGVWPDSNGNEY